MINEDHVEQLAIEWFQMPVPHKYGKKDQ